MVPRQWGVGCSFLFHWWDKWVDKSGGQKWMHKLCLLLQSFQVNILVDYGSYSHSWSWLICQLYREENSWCMSIIVLWKFLLTTTSWRQFSVIHKCFHTTNTAAEYTKSWLHTLVLQKFKFLPCIDWGVVSRGWYLSTSVLSLSQQNASRSNNVTVLAFLFIKCVTVWKFYLFFRKRVKIAQEA